MNPPRADGSGWDGLNGENDWLSREEAAAYARCSLATIDRARRSGNLHHSKPPGSRRPRFRRRWVDAWLAAGAVLPYLLALAFALSLVCYCHALHVNHGTHCIWF